MRIFKLVLMTTIMVGMFWWGYLYFYVGEYLKLGRIKSIPERICPVQDGGNLHIN